MFIQLIDKMLYNNESHLTNTTDIKWGNSIHVPCIKKDFKTYISESTKTFDSYETLMKHAINMAEKTSEFNAFISLSKDDHKNSIHIARFICEKYNDYYKSIDSNVRTFVFESDLYYSFGIKKMCAF